MRNLTTPTLLAIVLLGCVNPESAKIESKNSVKYDTAISKAASTVKNFNDGKLSCSLNGATVQSGQSTKFYSASLTLPGVSCDSIAQIRTCSNGVLTGNASFMFTSCGAVSTAVSASENIWKTISAAIDPRNLPLGSGKYVTSGPKRGYFFTCDRKMYEMTTVFGATKTGSWVHGNTFDITSKPSVQGNVVHAGTFQISTSGTNRVFLGNGLPMGVTTGVFPTASSDPAYEYDRNPTGLKEQTVSFSVPLNPVEANQPTCTGLELGITLDGVELSSGLDSSGRDEMAYEMMDDCSGMTQPGGLFHRHALSNCIPHIHDHNALVGYALDGFGIFSPYDKDGKEFSTADLDECHGITSPIEWNGVVTNMYHYVLTRDFPYSVSCFRGTPVAQNFPALPPPGQGLIDPPAQGVTPPATCGEAPPAPPPGGPPPAGGPPPRPASCTPASASAGAPMCPAGFKLYDGLWGVACSGTQSCWSMKVSGATGGIDGAPYGWGDWNVQCPTKQAAELTPYCPVGFGSYSGTFGTSCGGPTTCWSKKSSGARGGVDGSPYGWSDWNVQCTSNQSAALSPYCPVGFAAYSGTFGTTCGGSNTCWSKKSSGAAGGADGSPYGWGDWNVQCTAGNGLL
jgi:hypothetical protein